MNYYTASFTNIFTVHEFVKYEAEYIPYYKRINILCTSQRRVVIIQSIVKYRILKK